MTVPRLEVCGIRKEYPGTLALDDVSLAFEGGVVHALIGRNGAGKSTLLKLLAGSVRPTSGHLRVEGVETVLSSPLDAMNRGIAMVHQELSLVPGLTVAENILLGRMPRRGPFIRWGEARARAAAVLSELQVELDVRRKAGDLGVAGQQIVEIAKAMSLNPSVLMLDEPTSALARHETRALFALIRRVAARGVAVVYVSHRLQELKEIADVVTVLRDGRIVDTVPMADCGPARLVRMMFGGDVEASRPAAPPAGTRVVLDVRGLTRDGVFHEVSFQVREGEILGIAGMLGSGRTELLKAIFGAEPAETGEIRVDGRAVSRPTPRAMKGLGLAFTPENRKEEALVPRHSVRANLCMASLARIARRGFISRRMEQPVVDEQVRNLQIRVADTETEVASLSGGNQQKVVVGNWLANHPRVILFDEPTRGIDVQAKRQIFEAMWRLGREGVGSVFVSTELEELVEVCDRILIMRSGRITGSVNAADLAPDELYIRCMED